MADKSSVGVVVVGSMGRPMASRLLKAVAATPTMFGWGARSSEGADTQVAVPV